MCTTTSLSLRLEHSTCAQVQLSYGAGLTAIEAMASADPDLNFSVSELQQAGLLEAADIQQDEIFGPSLVTSSSASGNSSLDGPDGMQSKTNTETGPAPFARSFHEHIEGSSNAPGPLADSEKQTRAVPGSYRAQFSRLVKSKLLIVKIRNAGVQSKRCRAAYTSAHCSAKKAVHPGKLAARQLL